MIFYSIHIFHFFWIHLNHIPKQPFFANFLIKSLVFTQGWELTPPQSRCFFPNNDQTPQRDCQLYPFKTAAIMADEEDRVKMDDRLIILKESLSLCRRAAAWKAFNAGGVCHDW